MFIIVTVLVVLDCITIVVSYVLYFDTDNTFETIECRSAATTIIDFFALVIFGVCAVMTSMIKSAMERVQEKTQVIQSRFSVDIE